MKHVWEIDPTTNNRWYTDCGQEFCGGPTCMCCGQSFCVGCHPDVDDADDCDGSEIGPEVVKELQGQLRRAVELLDHWTGKHNEAVQEARKWKRLADSADVRAETELQQWLTKAIARRYKLRAVHGEVGQ